MGFFLAYATGTIVAAGCSVWAVAIAVICVLAGVIVARVELKPFSRTLKEGAEVRRIVSRFHRELPNGTGWALPELIEAAVRTRQLEAAREAMLQLPKHTLGD